MIARTDSKAAEASPVADSVRSVVSVAVDLCHTEKLLPQEAAIRALDVCSIDSGAASYLAVIGVAELVNRKLQRMRRSARSGVSESNTEPSRSVGPTGAERTQARRAALYHKVRSALDALYAGADGAMRSLRDFTLADHEGRLASVTEFLRGWKAAERFHLEAIAALRSAGAERIGALPAREQARLGGLLA